MFPERIGSQTMVKIGCRTGKRLTQAERDKIDTELYGENAIWEILHSANNPKRGQCKTTADEFYAECQNLAEQNLDEFIEWLCCEPRIAVTDDPAEKARYEKIVKVIFEDTEHHEEARRQIQLAKLHYFQDILPTLFEYKRRIENSTKEKFTETSISQVVFEAMDYAIEAGRSVLIEGNSGIGKTTAIKAWCQLHQAQARHVQLKGITHRTGFFREVARALGVAKGSGTSASKLQSRVEVFLQRTKMMLVIDEGQYLLPPGNRVGTPPELINWLNTACYNEGVPFVISATSEFRERRAIVEKNTTWQSEQLRRRINRYFSLPAVPTEDDLHRVARRLLPGMEAGAIKYVVGYSLGSKGFFQAITNAVEDAHLIASKNGRDQIKFLDLKAAIQDWRSPSDAALGRVFEEKPMSRCRRGGTDLEAQAPPDSEQVNAPLNRLSRPINEAAPREISPVLA